MYPLFLMVLRMAGQLKLHRQSWFNSYMYSVLLYFIAEVIFVRNLYLFSFCYTTPPPPPQLLRLQTQPGSWKSFYSSVAIKVQHIKLSPHLLLCHLIKRLLQENLWEMIYPADKTEPSHNQGSLKIKNVTLSWVCSVLCSVLLLHPPPPPAPNCSSFSSSPSLSVTVFLFLS